jgi:group I intron endonuclease
MLYSTMPNARQSGVYAITNSVTGGFYIGSSTNLVIRKRNHFTDLRCGVHCNPHLQSSWNKHGADAFRWEVVALVDEDETLATEGRLLAKLFDHPLCYNIVKEAVSGLTKQQMSPEMRERALRANVGRKQSLQSNAKRSAATRGRKRDPELVARTAAGNRGKKRTPEQRAKFASVATPEQRAKMIAAKTGKPQSEATKERRATAMRARWADPHYRARILAARPNTPEIVEKRAAANRGKKRSHESVARMSEAQRRVKHNGGWFAKRGMEKCS